MLHWNTKALQFYQKQRFGLAQLRNSMQESIKSFQSGTAFSAFGAKNDPSSSTPTAGQYMHGAGGVLSDPGQYPMIFSAELQPLTGMAAYLPVLPEPVLIDDDYGGYDVPYMTILSGVTQGDDDWADQPEAFCDNPPIAGLLKMCTQTSQFGLFGKSSRVLNILRLGRLNNVGEGTDFRVANHPVADDPFVPVENEMGAGSWINDEVAAKKYEMGVGFWRMMLPLMYTGDPVNDKAGGGARQFPGFDLLYNTGKVDVFTQNPCPSADSLVHDFNNTNVDEADANGHFIYEWIEGIENALTSRAEQTGLTPVGWVLSMRKSLFQRLVEFYVLQMHIFQIAHINTLNGGVAGNALLNYSGDQVAALRQDMRTRQYLPINGTNYQVIFDDGIAETTSGAEYISSIYFHPMTVLNGQPVTYLQFRRQDNGQANRLLQRLGGLVYSSDAGRFLWSTSFQNTCVELEFWTEPRIMCHTPFLAARIDNVAYQPVLHIFDALPGDANYYDGGRLHGTIPSGYPAWSPTTEVDLGVLS